MSWLSEAFGLGDVGVNMNDVMKQLNALPSPLSRAQALGALTVGYGAMSQADAGASSLGLPGGTQRGTVRANLDALAQQVNDSVDPVSKQLELAVKDGVERAVIEFNAVAEGQATLASARDQFWSDAYDALKQLPVNVGAAVDKVASYATGTIGNALGSFAFSSGGIVIIGLALGALYLLANSSAGSAYASAKGGRR